VSVCSAVSVRVPASTSNLGAGFDGLGMAVSLYVEVEVRLSERLAITVEGLEADQIDTSQDNLVYQRMASVFLAQGLPVPTVDLRICNQIPLIRGLGASGAASIAGLLAGSCLSGADLSHDEVLRRAVAAEHHPDNVTPALLGGFVSMALDQGAVRYVKMAVPDELQCALLVPRFGMKTAYARKILPTEVPLKDAVFNLTRTGLAVAAIAQRRYDLLGVATQDRLHQPYRQVLFPCMNSIFEAALCAGGYGAFLSGAGSTVLAFCSPDRAPAVASAMLAAAQAGQLEADTMVVPADNVGAVIS
jgi:homoserine kinase